METEEVVKLKLEFEREEWQLLREKLKARNAKKAFQDTQFPETLEARNAKKALQDAQLTQAQD